MEQIILKRHWLKFYGGLLFASAFFLGMGAGLIFLFLTLLKKEHMPIKLVLMPVFGLLCVFLMFYTVVIYFRSAPIIRIDAEKIQFPDKTYYWTDLSSVRLRGRKHFKYLFTSTAWGAAELYFKDNTSRFIFDDFYLHPWKWKMFVQKVIVEESPYRKEQDPPDHCTANMDDNYESYSGNFFTSLRGVILIAITVPFSFAILTSSRSHPPMFFLFIGIAAVCVLSFNGHLTHYFLVGNEHLIVRSHIFFWKKKVFKLSDIAEVSIDNRHRLPNFLKLSTGDFKNYTFFAATLRDKTWLRLKERLEEQGIEVRNYVI